MNLTIQWRYNVSNNTNILKSTRKICTKKQFTYVYGNDKHTYRATKEHMYKATIKHMYKAPVKKRIK